MLRQKKHVSHSVTFPSCTSGLDTPKWKINKRFNEKKVETLKKLKYRVDNKVTHKKLTF